MNNVKRRLRLLLLAAISLVPVAKAHAQETNPAVSTGAADVAEDNVGLSEIVVTAQKRDENLQRVPISIAAVSGEELAKQQIQSLRELVSATPNIAVTSAFGDGLPIFAIRGVTVLNYGVTETSPVATYYDEVYKGDVTLLGVGLYDLERVEVLKGPQGTLYGRSTTGGAVNLVSRKPQFKNQGDFSLSYGKFNRATANGAVEGRLSDELGARVAFTFDRDDGTMENVFPGAPDVAQTRQYAVRASLRFRPSDDVDIVLRGSTSLQNAYSAASVILPIPLENGIGGPVYGVGDFRTGLNRRQINTPDVFREHMRTFAFAANATFRLSDTLSLTSVTSYDRGKLYQPNEGDGSPAKIALVIQDSRETQVSEDIRLTSDFDTPFNFILGAYYGRNSSFNQISQTYFADLDINGGGVDASDCIDSGYQVACDYYVRNNIRKTSRAVYTDFSYKLTDRLTLRGGARYSNEKGRLFNYLFQVRDIAGNVLDNGLTFGGPADTTSFSDNYNNKKVSLKAGIDYVLPGGTLVYASYNIGYRASSFNSGLVFDPLALAPAKPERLAAAEIGFKSELFDRRLRLNGAFFYYDFKDQQVFSGDPSLPPGVLRASNIDKSRILGAEFSANARVSDRLTLNAAVGLVDSKVIRGTISGASIAGNKLVQAPELTATASFDYALPIGSWGALDFHGDVAYTGAQYFLIQNEFAPPNSIVTPREPGYAVVNAQVRLHPESDNYGISLWVKNLNKAYYHSTLVDASAFGYIYSNVNPPRSFGVAVDAKF